MTDIILEAEQTETVRPDISHLITEADTPVDNIFRSYFIWEFGKPPDVVMEVVSNRKGERQRADEAEERVERLATQLRALSVVPDAG